MEPEIYDPPRTCWNCGRKVDGYWVGIEPVTFCSKDCEVHYQRKVQRAREMVEEARLAAEREELARLRAEQAERDRIAREALDRIKARLDAMED